MYPGYNNVCFPISGVMTGPGSSCSSLDDTECISRFFSSWFRQRLLPWASICELPRQFDLNLNKNGMEINLEANITWMTRNQGVKYFT